ncbi:DUF4225 domain-containing protein [Serratia plymuthica]|uniref:DUF4225 domain-containing protein n=1 Tax=Serratia plymuthica TaxID=82996 RepID=UPI001F52D9A0|nr:DUF4225 domain-containing protein [Serratia plymuthica]UNK26844.1 DUF4225 domain-containing protein [Serratia plymuthica]
MDNYLDKQRLNSYYLMLAQREADNLRNYARQVSSYHLKNLIPYLNFNNEIAKLIQAQMERIHSAGSESECRECLFNLREEKRFISQQDMALRTGSAKIIASAELVHTLDSWGYMVNGIGVALGTGQIIAGLGITAASLGHLNIVGVFAGVALILHGTNGIQESVKNINSGLNNNTGFLKNGYIATARFIGFDARIGAIAYSVADVALSAYGLARMILKPDSWRLFRFLPSDFVRNIRTTSAPALLIEGLGDGLSIKSAYDSYSK